MCECAAVLKSQSHGYFLKYLLKIKSSHMQPVMMAATKNCSHLKAAQCCMIQKELLTSEENPAGKPPHHRLGPLHCYLSPCLQALSEGSYSRAGELCSKLVLMIDFLLSSSSSVFGEMLSQSLLKYSLSKGHCTTDAIPVKPIQVVPPTCAGIRFSPGN